MGGETVWLTGLNKDELEIAENVAYTSGSGSHGGRAAAVVLMQTKEAIFKRRE